MTPVPVQVVGAAALVRDDARDVPWREERLDKFASVSTRMLVSATASALAGTTMTSTFGLIGVYLSTGETGLDVDAFLVAARVAWDEHADDPDYRWMGGRALRAIDPYYSLRTLANGPAALLAMQLEAIGPSLNVAHQRCGTAWALVAALDDLRRGRCDTAIVGACDQPSVPSRRAVARRRSAPQGRDGAAVLVLQRPGDDALPRVQMAVAWEAASPPAGFAVAGAAVSRRGATASPLAEGADDGVTTPLRLLLERGLAANWTTSYVVAMEDGAGGRAVVTVEA